MILTFICPISTLIYDFMRVIMLWFYWKFVDMNIHNIIISYIAINYNFHRHFLCESVIKDDGIIYNSLSKIYLLIDSSQKRIYHLSINFKIFML